MTLAAAAQEKNTKTVVVKTHKDLFYKGFEKM